MAGRPRRYVVPARKCEETARVKNV